MSDDAPLGFLVLPGPGDGAARALADRVRTVAFKRFVADDRRGLAPATARALAALQARAYELATRDPIARAQLGAAFEDLDVQTCALALDTPQRQDAARTLGRALVDAAHAAGLTALTWTPVPASDADVDADVDVVGGGGGAPALHPVCAALPQLALATRDRNPLRFVEAHPDKEGNALDLGGHPVAAWTAALADAIEMITQALPALGAELAVTFRRVVPIGFDAERHLSCSYREAPGLVYLTLHPNVLTMAEAIVHETQHTKLNLLSWVDPVLDNPPDERVASPVRPDLRPLFGVLLAVHAFVPVAWLHQRLAALDHPITRSPWFARRRRQVLAGNAEGLDVLRARARPTPTGARVLAALDALDAAVR